ncbi:MAG: hypothetical protein ACOC7T_02520 [Planctomycetota bacterium]
MKPERVFEEQLEGTVHKETQVDEHGVHLTVGNISKTHAHGDLDFGGSEMKECKLHEVEPLEQQPGDRYAWWRLEEGRYVVEFNERIKDGSPCMLVVSNDRLLNCGCSIAATAAGPGPVRTVLDVPGCGVRIKENARIALLLG